MGEIEKMYENAGVKKEWNSTPYGGVEEYYPSFTAEKQLELIKWLAFKDIISIIAHLSGEYYSEYDNRFALENSLEESLAKLINNIWRDITEEEKQQVKGILE